MTHIRTEESVLKVAHDEPYFEHDKENDTIAFSLGKTIGEGVEVCREIVRAMLEKSTAVNGK